VDIFQLNLAILIGAGLVTFSALTSLLTQRIGAPLLLLFLGIGLLAGEDGILGIEFDNGAIAYFVGSLALAIILFDSGFETRIRSFRVAGAPALTLATLGVLLTTGLVGAAAHFFFAVGWVEAFLLGAIVASTDAAAVFFLLRVGGITVRERVRSTLEVESGANDPMAIFLTATLVEIAASPGEVVLGWELLRDFGLQMAVGIAGGLVGGLGIAALLNRLRALEAGLYPIVALAAALVVFAATGLLGGSGFLAAYVAGIVAGNRRVRYVHRIRQFQVGMTWLAQIVMFLTLGLLATPTQFGAVLAPAILLAFVLILVARPVAVWLCLLPFGFSAREVMFVSWVGLRGAVSILLAILPGLDGLLGGQNYFNIVFVMVVTSLAIQGWTIGPAARRLRLLVPQSPGILDRVELELPGDAAVELVAYAIHPDSAVARGERVPRWARPLLVVRDGVALSVQRSGPLKAGDRVYLFASPTQVRRLDRVYTRPAEEDDNEIIGDFVLSASTTLGDLAKVYGTPAGPKPEQTLDERLTAEFLGQPGIGDEMALGPVRLVVRTVGDNGHVTEVAIVLDPGRGRARHVIASSITPRLRKRGRR
jgi:cell volume regulation protein A